MLSTSAGIPRAAADPRTSNDLNAGPAIRIARATHFACDMGEADGSTACAVTTSADTTEACSGGAAITLALTGAAHAAAMQARKMMTRLLRDPITLTIRSLRSFERSPADGPAAARER